MCCKEDKECCKKCCGCECTCNRLEIHLASGRLSEPIRTLVPREYGLGTNSLNSRKAGENFGNYIYDRCNYIFVDALVEKLQERRKIV